MATAYAGAHTPQSTAFGCGVLGITEDRSKPSESVRTADASGL